MTKNLGKCTLNCSDNIIIMENFEEKYKELEEKYEELESSYNTAMNTIIKVCEERDDCKKEVIDLEEEIDRIEYNMDDSQRCGVPERLVLESDIEEFRELVYDLCWSHGFDKVKGVLESLNSD